jgi:hypothetical protein
MRSLHFSPVLAEKYRKRGQVQNLSPSLLFEPAFKGAFRVHRVSILVLEA